MNYPRNSTDSTRIWRPLLERGLQDDHPEFDWTTLGLQEKRTQKAKAEIISKSSGIWVGATLARVFQEYTGLDIEYSVPEGTTIRDGELLCRWAGPVETILRCE